ncbi:MAG TPA: hypothetical protein PK149_14600, partial [Flavobacteriales bacterium]|nr:hypothetical protein [Flavobacteriales bacterium]
KILGRPCELKTTSERYLSYYWISDLTTPNPIFDMARWMEPRPSQKFKDIMFFGATDQPMPFAVMGTRLSSFKPGKAKPPVIDLSNYRVSDQRIEQRRPRDEPDVIEQRIITMEDLEGDDVEVPVEEVPEYMIAEPRMEMPEPPPVAPPKP